MKSASWYNMGYHSREIWKDLGGDEKEVLPIEKFGGYKTKEKEIIEERERLALRNRVKEEKRLVVYAGLREDTRLKTYLHGPMDHTEKLKLRFREGDPVLTEI